MRIAIVGNSGSGKSTLAGRLATDTDIPVLDLDTVAWEAAKTAVPRAADEAAADVHTFCNASRRWIIEGCYAHLIESALKFKPQLLVLDPGLQQCLSNCRTRPWEPHKYASMEEQDEHLAFLLGWVAGYYERDDDMSLAAHKLVFEGYDGPKQWLSSLSDPILSPDKTC